MKKIFLLILSLFIITPVFSEYYSCNLENTIEVVGNAIQNEDTSITPYINIYYYDEDNQYISGQYLLSDLYLDGNFKKIYTGGTNNYWVLTPVFINTSEVDSVVYTPVFDFTGSTQDVDTDYNMFNNFSDNALQVLLSNLPGYIQYVFITFFILLLIGIVKLFKRRK